jgi:hypothetical protein
VPRTAAFRPATFELMRVRAEVSAMSNGSDDQDEPLARSATNRKGRASRCYQCHGSFGLVRSRLGLKQFCSTRCLDQYKADVERTTTRIKEWAHFLSRKL